MQNPSNPSVFIVDDSEPVRERIKELLEARSGARIVGEAATAGHAIPGIQACRPDFVVLDYQLPDGNGLDVLREVRGESAGTCFIVLTNHPTTELRDAFSAAGARFFLDKSFEFGRLVRLIAAAQPEHRQRTPEVLFGS